MHSEQIGDLAKALALAQAAITPPTKGKTAKAGTYSYNYADLADVIASYRTELSKVGLSLTQTFRAENGHLILVTDLLHTSGQWVSSEYPLTLYTKPQEQGSAITYARRYNVSAILGIAAEEDDDGAAAQGGESKTKEEKREATDAKFESRIKDVQRLAFEVADFSKKNPEDELFAAAGVKKASEIKTIKHADSAVDNLMKRAKLLEAEGKTPF